MQRVMRSVMRSTTNKSGIGRIGAVLIVSSGYGGRVIIYRRDRREIRSAHVRGRIIEHREIE